MSTSPETYDFNDDFVDEAFYDDLSLLSGGAELLDDIEPLWLMLRQHHADMAPIWRAGLNNGTFADRKAGLIRKSDGGALLVVLAVRHGEPCGYCVCTVNKDGEGEVDSLFVAPDVRRRGIGDALMTRAMPWLAQHVRDGTIIIDILSCNDAALRFYERYGFHSRTVRMRHVPTTPAEVMTSASAVDVSETPPEPAPPPLPLEYRTLRKSKDPMEAPAVKRGPRTVIPIEFNVVIAQTQDQAAAGAIEHQLKGERIPFFRTHDGPAVDQTIGLLVREDDRERAMRVAEAIFIRRSRIKSFPRQSSK